MRPTRLAPLFAAALVLPVPALVAATAPAASALPSAIVVDTWDDELNADGDCSLREAVAVVNSGADVDACTVASAPIVDLPAGGFHLDAPLIFTESAILQGVGAVTSSIDCSAAVGDCLDDTGVGTDLTLRRLQISTSDSALVRSGPGAGSLLIEDSVLYGGYSGVVSHSGPIRVERSSVWDNDNLGIGSLGSNVVLVDSVVGGNDTAGLSSVSGVVSVSGSTVWQNEGDGIRTASGNVLVAASTVAENDEDAVRTQTGTITYSSATVVGNRRALNVTGAGVARAVNTVFARHDGGNCDNPIDSLGFNVSDDDTCSFDRPTDRNAIDPGLEPVDVFLARPGYPLAADSPLVDTGASCHPTDEIGTLRPLDGDGDGVAGCDVGALERPAVPLDPGEPTPGDDGTDDPPPTDPAPQPASPATPVPARPAFTG